MKTIQQILEEERAKSRLNEVSEGHISHVLTNKSRINDSTFQKNCQIAQQKVWNDPIKSAKRLEALNKNWAENPEKMIKGRYKSIHVPWGNFPSRQEALDQGILLGIKQPGVLILKGLKEDKDNFYYIDKKHRELSKDSIEQMKKTKKENGSKRWTPYQTPFGIFNTLKETLVAMKANKVPNPKHTIKKLLIDPNSGYKKL